MKPAKNQELLTTDDIAKRLKTTRLFVAKLIRKGHLKAFKYGTTGGRYRIEEADYQEFVSKRKKDTAKRAARASSK